MLIECDNCFRRALAQIVRSCHLPETFAGIGLRIRFNQIIARPSCICIVTRRTYIITLSKTFVENLYAWSDMCILLPPWCQVELIIELCPVDCKHAYAEITANAIFFPRREQPGDRRCAGLCLRCSLGRRAFTSRVAALLCEQSQLFVVCDVWLVTCSVACSGTHASRKIRIVCVLSFIEPPIFYTFVSSIRRSERSIRSPMICYFVSRSYMKSA